MFYCFKSSAHSLWALYNTSAVSYFYHLITACIPVVHLALSAADTLNIPTVIFTVILGLRCLSYSAMVEFQ